MNSKTLALFHRHNREHFRGSHKWSVPGSSRDLQDIVGGLGGHFGSRSRTDSPPCRASRRLRRDRHRLEPKEINGILKSCEI